MIYVTGDKHRSFSDVVMFCDKLSTTKNDILVILGDAGINFTGNSLDTLVKQQLSKLPIRFLCVHGNHEQRPVNIPSYKEVPFLGGVAYCEEDFPSILFAKDGEVYTFDENGKKAIVIGGAYSIDKEYRLERKLAWWADEQPSSEIKTYVEQSLSKLDYNVDYVFTHTCPKKFTPKERLLQNVKQRKVDKSTEIWLDTIESKLAYERWYCGHWHTNKVVEKIHFLFEDFVELGK